MSESAARNQGRDFISYRREDTAYPAGWLFDRLAEHFGSAQVFKDVDSIELGDDFVEVITTAVASCDVLLALIGSQWVSITDHQGMPRLDNSGDFVRLAIDAALVRHRALELSPSRFDFDTKRLVSVLNKALGNVQRPSADNARSAGSREKDIGPSARAEPRTESTATVGNTRRFTTRVEILLGAGVVIAFVIIVLLVVHRRSGTRRSQVARVIFTDEFSDNSAGWQLTAEATHFKGLAVAPLTVDPNSSTRMHAECTGDASKQHLVFSLNNRHAAQVDDADFPPSTGSVGLGVLTDPGNNSIVAEFHTLAVATVAGA